MNPPLPSPSPALVADDAPVARVAVARLLRARGVAYVEADSAAAAAKHDPTALSCALLDLDLGDGTGVEVALALRAKRPDMPIAFFSSGASAEVMAHARAIGPLFAKPDALEDAVAWVEAHATT